MRRDERASTSVNSSAFVGHPDPQTNSTFIPTTAFGGLSSKQQIVKEKTLDTTVGTTCVEALHLCTFQQRITRIIKLLLLLL